jgi:uncharacterized protein
MLRRGLRTDGISGAIGPKKIMVVAPYNAQASCLRERPSDGVRVGTVDKFQGQEAAVCLFSMTTLGGEECLGTWSFCSAGTG